MNVPGPCPGRHHTTPDQVHETCSSHVECAGRDWSPGRDKAQEATSLTTALVLAGNDKIFCPHKPRQSSADRAQEGRQARQAARAESVLQSRMYTTLSGEAIAPAPATVSPIALLTTLHVESCLLASLPHSSPTPHLL